MIIKVFWGILVAIVVGLQYRLWVGEGSFAQAYAMQQEIAQQTADNQRLHQRNEKLYAEVLGLKEVQGAIEESARHQLGMIYPEEQFFWLIEDAQRISE